MSIPELCPLCGSPQSQFRRSPSTGRVACGICGETVGKDDFGDRPRPPRAGRAADRATGPAIGLLVVGALSAVITLVVTVGAMMAAVDGPEPLPAGAPPDEVAGQRFGYYFALVSWPVGSLTLTAVILFGGSQMLTRRSWAWSVVGTVAAMIPCCNLTFLIGIPIGVWALVVLFDPPVRAAFR